MGGALEKLQHELEAVQRALAEAEARYVRQEAKHQSVLEEGEKARKKIEQAHREWITALDVVADPIFVHDQHFRILRCNKAYQQSAGIPFKQIIGQPYYDIFPKTPTPLPNCLRAMNKFEEEEEEEEEVIVGDTTYFSRAYSVKDTQGSYLYSVHILENINERLQANLALRESELRYRRLFEAARDGILMLDADSGKIVDANPFILNLLSYSLSECTAKKLWEIGLFKDVASSKTAFRELQDKGYIHYEDLLLETKDGRRIDVEFVCNIYEVGGRKVVQCNIRDITESLRAKAMLIASHDLLQNVVENTPVRVFWKDAELRYLGCNSAFARDAGMSRPEEVIGKDDFQMGWYEQAELYRADDRQVIDSGMPIIGREEPQTTPDGQTIWLRTSKVPLRAADGNIFGMLGIYEDITERREAEQSLKQFRALLDNSSDAIEVLDPVTFGFLDVNETVCRDLGYSREELLSMRVFDIDSELDEDSAEVLQKQIQSEGSARFDSAHRRRDGSTFPVEVNIKLVEVDKPYLLSIVRDITERKQAEESLHRSNRALQTLSAGNLALVQAKDEDGLLRSITRVIAEQGGYSMVVVDYANNDPEKSITPMAWFGFEGSHYWADHLNWADTERGQLPVSKSIRSGMTQVCHDVSTNPSFHPWREAVQAHDYQANIALPLREGGKTFGGLSIYSADVNAFDDEEVRLLEELANDLAYGIVTLRARVEQAQHAIILRQSLEQSIETIANTVEARDPYTAGHQRRVAELATAIAREMGLPEDEIHGIRLASIIHDLGKIHIPAEILSKPGKLNEIEHAFIKSHPQAGYDILKGVKFPWPIADIVLQHHERLDGSGYPQGLKGDAILLNARIMSVADVVEAMSSHRPYRPGLGIEAALDEITLMRGRHFDPQVVDVCVALFREKKYVIPD